MIELSKLMEQLGPGRVFVIYGDSGAPIGALTAEPGTGVERVIEALAAYKCPEKTPHTCLPIYVCEDSRVVVESGKGASTVNTSQVVRNTIRRMLEAAITEGKVQ